MPRKRQQPVYQVPTPAPPLETEADLLRRAFGLIQRRITEYLAGVYPEARWIWETPNAQANIAEGEPVSIFLNRAGGFRKAEVQIVRLQFKGLRFEAVSLPEVTLPEEPSEEPDGTDYSYLAYEWVEANLSELNARAAEAGAQGDVEISIAADELPDPASWKAICDELLRNGFSAATATETEIAIKFSK